LDPANGVNPRVRQFPDAQFCSFPNAQSQNAVFKLTITESLTDGDTRKHSRHERKTAQKSKASPTVGVAGMPSLVKSTNCLVVELKPRPANLRLS